MSEYQYYEFLAIDRPLDDDEQTEVRSLSTRARITATSFVNEYHWGDFKSDPNQLMVRYYDAHLYVANWGTHRVMFRLPCDLLDPDVVEDYCVDDQARVWVRNEFIVLGFTCEDHAGEFDFDYDAEALLSAIVGVRAELAAGDFRPLYLAWLAAYGAWERDEDVFDRDADDDLEPPVPPGLGTLTAAQRALADFLRLDDDLLAIAAQTSPPLEEIADDPSDLADWVIRLPVAEKNRLLTRVVQGEAARVRMELLRRFRGDTALTIPAPTRRTVADLLDDAARRRARHATHRSPSTRRTREPLRHVHVAHHRTAANACAQTQPHRAPRPSRHLSITSTVGSVEDDLQPAKVAGLAEELAGLRALTVQLRAENARLLRLLELTPKQAAPPGPVQTGFFEAHPGPIDRRSEPEVKVDFFADLFAARTDIYATRGENVRAGKAGWLPAVRGGWRKGIRHEDRHYLPLSKNVLRAHLTGEVHVGLYPLLDGDLCWWLAADFDGPMAMLDALAYLTAARAWSVPAALEVSRSGVGAHAWMFFTAPVPAETARRLGTALLREAMAVRGHMDLASYDRLFPSQDVLPSAAWGI